MLGARKAIRRRSPAQRPPDPRHIRATARVTLTACCQPQARRTVRRSPAAPCSPPRAAGRRPRWWQRQPLLHSLLVEVFATDRRHLGRGGQIDRGLGPLFRRDGGNPGQQPKEATEQPPAVSKIGLHETRMKGIDRHPMARQPPGQFAREEDVGQLRLAVGPPRAVIRRELQVAEVDLAAAMGIGRDVNDPRGAAFQQKRQKQMGQVEITEMVEREGHFEAISVLLPLPEDRARIVHQDIQPLMLLAEGGGKLFDARLMRKIARQVVYGLVARRLLYLANCLGPPLGIAPH